jgi:hypothetical protein
MAEVIIKSSLSEGDTITVSYNKKKENLSIKVHKGHLEPEENS